MNKLSIGAFIAGIALLSLPLQGSVVGHEFHVARNGKDGNPGTAAAPLHTIQRAAELAQPGDVVTVHAGVYRECIRPPRGGASAEQRIVYRAAPGEVVEITGSEPVTNWVKVRDGVWKVTIPNSFFGKFNPFNDLIRGDWFEPLGRQHHTGAVYLNGDWLAEAATRDDVLKPRGTMPLWFGQVDNDNTTIWAQFPNVDPNHEQVEINVRRAVFYPDRPGINFLTVRGFTLRNAATPWAPPTAEQVGLIGTNWSKGWIIENNVISHSVCSGISLGKYGDQWDNTSANSAEGYVQTIERALQNGWNGATVGHHVVRNNTISHCEQAGIVGSLGAAFSEIRGNTIHDIHVRKLFSGAEMAGIKFHGAVDVAIRKNHIFKSCRGIWLDWMAQGTRVSSNVFHDNASEDLFFEVDHGPFLVDNNLFLSAESLLDLSEGGAYLHNLVTGKITSHPDLGRSTPHLQAHSTAIAGSCNTQGGDNRFYNNIFIGRGASAPAANSDPPPAQSDSSYGLSVYDGRQASLKTGGNVYYHGARPAATETANVVLSADDPQVKLIEAGPNVFLHLTFGEAIQKSRATLVTTELLGKTKVTRLPFENPDGAALKIDHDFFGMPRNEASPTAGPFEKPGAGALRLKVW